MTALNISDQERRAVLSMHRQGVNDVVISRRTGLNLITVNNIINSEETQDALLGKVIEMTRKPKRDYVRYTRQQKDDALELIDAGFSIVTVAKDMGASLSAVYSWVRARDGQIAGSKQVRREAKAQRKEDAKEDNKPAVVKTEEPDVSKAVSTVIIERDANKDALIEFLMREIEHKNRFIEMLLKGQK